MPSIGALLQSLERQDQMPGDHAFAAALDQVLTIPTIKTPTDPSGVPVAVPDPAINAAIEATNDASRVVWDTLIGTSDGSKALMVLNHWAEQRLTNWHSIKTVALRSAYLADPTTADVQTMRHGALVDLRQGLVEHPDLIPDAHLLQGLARSGYHFAWTQAVSDLRVDGVPLPDDTSTEMQRLCAICTNAFKFLIST